MAPPQLGQLSTREEEVLRLIRTMVEDQCHSLRGQWIRASDAEDELQEQLDQVETYIGVLVEQLQQHNISVPPRVTSQANKARYLLNPALHESQMYQ